MNNTCKLLTVMATLAAFGAEGLEETDAYYPRLSLANPNQEERLAVAQGLERLQQQGVALPDHYRAAMQRALVEGYYTRLSAANPNQEERLAAAQGLERLLQQGVALPDHYRAAMQRALVDGYYIQLGEPNPREQQFATDEELHRLLQQYIDLQQGVDLQQYIDLQQDVDLPDHYRDPREQQEFAAARELERLQQEGVDLPDHYRAAMQRALVDGYCVQLSRPNLWEPFAAARGLQRLLQQGGVELPNHYLVVIHYIVTMFDYLAHNYYTQLSAANPRESFAAAQGLQRLLQRDVELPDHYRDAMQQVLNRQ